MADIIERIGEQKCCEYATSYIEGDQKKICELEKEWKEEPDQWLIWICIILSEIAENIQIDKNIRYKAATYMYHFYSDPLQYESKYEKAIQFEDCRELLKMGIENYRKEEKTIAKQYKSDYDDIVKCVYQK